MNKAQYAVEYMLIIGIGLLILIPSIAIFYNYSQSQSDEAIISRVESIGRNIVSNAEIVHHMGPPSRRTVQHEFPSKIHNITILSGEDVAGNPYHEIRFTVGDRRVVYPFPSNVPISGPFYHNRTGLRCDDPDANNACFTSGNRLVILDSQNLNVSISIR